MATNVIDALEKRGFIDAMTGEELRKEAEGKLKVYCGFDPTGDSLHIGNMIPMMGLRWFQKFGHTPYAIVGGATGMIGDPSGKSAERVLLDEATIAKHVIGIKKNLEQILDFTGENQAVILNNYDWFKDIPLVNFLRDTGKYFRVGVMLAKDSVKNRLNSEEGISFTEFTYQVLQGYDFLYLYEKYGVNVQIGGSDQWGNIIAGTDLMRKALGVHAHALTFPLLVKSDGQKFGKTEKGAVWLDPNKTSPYEFYQYFFRTSDADVIKLLRFLTFLDMEEIQDLEMSMNHPNYLPNTLQKRLAEETTLLVHGEEGLKSALRATEGAAPGTSTALDATLLESLAADMPCQTYSRKEIVGIKLIDILTMTGLQKSKGDARKLIRNGGVYLNNQKVENEGLTLEKDNMIDGRMFLLAAGKKNKLLIRLNH